MKISSPYLRVGPVAIHIRSQETSDEFTLSSGGDSTAEPTLGVQGSVFLSPNDGTSIEELNGVVSESLIYTRRIPYEEGYQVSSNTSSPSLPVPTSLVPSSVASIPYSSISPPVGNVNNVSAS